MNFGRTRGTCPDSEAEPRSPALQADRYFTELHGNFPSGSGGKVSAYNVGDLGLIPGLGRSLGERNGNPLQNFCLENPTYGGAW